MVVRLADKQKVCVGMHQFQFQFLAWNWLELVGIGKIIMDSVWNWSQKNMNWLELALKWPKLIGISLQLTQITFEQTLIDQDLSSN
jgi:hypothetical protein